MRAINLLAGGLNAWLLSISLATVALAQTTLSGATFDRHVIKTPIGCLMNSTCLQSRGMEGARKDSLITLSQIKQGNVLPQHVMASNVATARGGMSARSQIARDLFNAARADLGGVSRDSLIATGPMPKGMGILEPMPSELQLRLKNYTATDDFLDCTSVFEAMRRANARLADFGQRAIALEGLYIKYLDACHRGSLRDLGAAASRLVLLLRSDRAGNLSAYCTGFNFAHNLILTARHCLVEMRAIELVQERYAPGDRDAYISVEGALPGSRALVFSEADKLYKLRRPLERNDDLNFYPFELDRDAAVLEIVADAGRAARVPAFPIDDARQWDRIRFPAVFIEDQYLTALVRKGRHRDVANALLASSALDVGPLCALVYSKDSAKSFLYHGCQSRVGYSGSPLLRVESTGAITLVGVHSGAVDAAKPVDAWPYALLFPNYGVRLPQGMVGSR